MNPIEKPDNPALDEPGTPVKRDQQDEGPGYELPGDGQGDGSIDLGRSNDAGGAIDNGGMPDTGLPSDES